MKTIRSIEKSCRRILWLVQSAIVSTAAFASQEGDFQFEITGENATITRYLGQSDAVVIPDHLGGNLVTSIGASAFSHDIRLVSVYIPRTVTSIGSAAYLNCTSLTNVNIPNSVTNIGAGAFFGCTSLARLIIPSSVNTIGVAAFSTCTSLTNLVVEPGNSPFASAAGVLFNKKLSTLVAYPAGNTGSYTVPNSVTNIGHASFQDCSRLTSVIIPEVVISIGDYAFFGCSNLTSVFFEGNAPSSTGIYHLMFGNSPLVTVFYRAGAVGWGERFQGRPTAVWIPLTSYEDWTVSTGLLAQFPSTYREAEDPDGDGIDNRNEWIAGTDPTRKASALAFELSPRPTNLAKSDQTLLPANRRAVYFRSVPGRYYGIQSTTTVTGPWTIRAVRIAAADTSQTRIVLNESTENTFYRVLVLP